MKRYLTIFILLLCIICSAQENRVLVNASWTGFHCNGQHGFCTIDNATNRSHSNTEIVLNENGTLTFKIERSKLSPANLKSITGTTSILENSTNQHYFAFANTYTLPVSVAKALHRENEPLQIGKGHYPIQVMKRYLTITFALE